MAKRSYRYIAFFLFLTQSVFSEQDIWKDNCVLPLDLYLPELSNIDYMIYQPDEIIFSQKDNQTEEYSYTNHYEYYFEDDRLIQHTVSGYDECKYHYTYEEDRLIRIDLVTDLANNGYLLFTYSESGNLESVLEFRMTNGREHPYLEMIFTYDNEGCLQERSVWLIQSHNPPDRVLLSLRKYTYSETDHSITGSISTVYHKDPVSEFLLEYGYSHQDTEIHITSNYYTVFLNTYHQRRLVYYKEIEFYENPYFPASTSTTELDHDFQGRITMIETNQITKNQTEKHLRWELLYKD